MPSKAGVKKGSTAEPLIFGAHVQGMGTAEPTAQLLCGREGFLGMLIRDGCSHHRRFGELAVDNPCGRVVGYVPTCELLLAGETDHRRTRYVRRSIQDVGANKEVVGRM